MMSELKPCINTDQLNQLADDYDTAAKIPSLTEHRARHFQFMANSLRMAAWIVQNDDSWNTRNQDGGTGNECT